MDVVLVSARAAHGSAHWSASSCARVGGELTAKGARVRWLWCASEGATPPAVPPGVELVPVVSPLPPFRAVDARIADASSDQQLARLLRPLRRSCVVHFGLGAVGSATALWLAERMGARPIAVVAAREALCARNTLVDATGSACTVVDDAARCTQCLSSPWEHGLTKGQAKCARALRWLGGHSPFPSRIGVLTRTDLVLGSLVLAEVLVASESERALLAAAGVPSRSLAVVGGSDHPDASAVARELGSRLVAG